MSSKPAATTEFTMRHYLDDGLVEMTLGSALVLMALMLFARESVTFLWYLPWMLFYLLLPQAKSKYSVPRGGVRAVELAGTPKWRLKLTVLLVAGVLAGLGVLFMVSERAPWMTPILAATSWAFEHAAATLSLVLVCALVYLGRAGGGARFYWLALWAAICGLSGGFLIEGARIGAQLALAAIGVLTIATGIAAYRRFRASHPLVQPS